MRIHFVRESRQRLRSTLVLASLGGVAGASWLSGCSLLPGRDAATGSAEGTVETLVSALSEHTLDEVPLLDPGARDRFAAQLGALTSYPVSVTAGEIDQDGDRAGAVLTWTWRLGGRRWSYETTVGLSTHGADDTKPGLGWFVDWRPDSLLPQLGADDVVDVVRTAAPRADILGANDVPLVTERRVLRYGLDKSRVRPSETTRSAVRVARVLDINARAFGRAVQASGPDAFVEGIVLRAEDAHEAVGPTFAEIPGALAIDATLPLAPTRDFASAILGRVGPATAEVIEKSGGRTHDGDEVGLSGLQARYDARLAGVSGIEVRARAVEDCADWPTCPDASDETRILASWKAERGTPLHTTLDTRLQGHAEEALARASTRLGDDADSPGDLDGPDSALVAIRPSTGEILAAANGPANDGLNAATYGQYAPGSTFKVVSALALLRAGLDPTDDVGCPVTTTVDGKKFKNYDDYPADRLGTVSFTTAIANSCNTAVIGERGRLDARDLTDAAASLGLGVDHDLGFPAYFGQVPSPGGETEKAAGLIGQGKVLASPLAMASVAASVAAGQTVVPHLLAPEADHPLPTAGTSKPLTADEAQALRALMRAVVTEGSGQFLADLPGEIGAKTGTAEYGEPAADGSLPTHTWMIAAHGDLAVAVFVETGASGSQTAGPILEDFLR